MICLPISDCLEFGWGKPVCVLLSQHILNTFALFPIAWNFSLFTLKKRQQVFLSLCQTRGITISASFFKRNLGYWAWGNSVYS